MTRSTGTITFRGEVRPTDPAAVRLLAESCELFYPDEIDVAVELVDERLAKGLDSGYHFLFAEMDDRVVGYTCFGPIPCTRARFDLYWIIVDGALHMHGIGRALMRETDRVVASLGGVRIYIETSSRMQYDATRAFYLACGCRVDAMLRDFYFDGDDKFIYARDV